MSQEPIYFLRDDPKLLGETIVLGAQLCFARNISRTIVYECNNQFLKFISGGNPFRVDVFEIDRENERIVFDLQNTGDGLTFQFARLDHQPVTRLIINSAKDYALGLKHNL